MPGILLKTLMVFGLMFMFIQNNSLKAQVINNQGAVISITNAAVQGDTLENTAGTINNYGTIQLNGHYINIDTTQGDGIYNLRGNWANSGTFNEGLSTVNFIGSGLQSITGPVNERFYNLNINNTGSTYATNRIILLSNVDVVNNLGFLRGNVETGLFTLYLINQDVTSLNYTSGTGSRIVGKFERGVNSTNNYLFPLGSATNYNPMNLTFNNLTSPGSILSEFVLSDPGSAGLPLADPGYVNPSDSVEVYDADSTGYWSVFSKGLFLTNDYDVSLDGTGFETPFQNATRIIKRPAGGNWILEGKHKDAVGPVTYRNTLDGGIFGTPGHEFGWGKIRPRIQKQPEDTAICDGESATFHVVSTGRGGLSYKWEVHERSGPWRPIVDDATYANSDTDTLLILSADTTMSGYKYRVIITDSLGNFKQSNSQATLTVNPRPVVTATPQQDTICNGETTFIDLNSTVNGTIYTLEVLYFGSIGGTSTTLVDDTTIQQTLINPTLSADSVVYRIFPTGPSPTDCGGTADTVVIWVEPTVIIDATSDTICNGDFTDLDITSENVTTNGIHYTWTSSATDPDVSGYTDNIVGQDTLINLNDQLVNVGVDSAIVRYTITPWTLDASGNLKCSGIPINIDVWVEPTVNINSVNDTLCNGDATNIVINSSYTTTNGIFYTWTATATDPDVTGYTDNSAGQDISANLVEILDNSGTDSAIVHYTITPWTLDATGNLKCQGVPINIEIWVNPTPQVFTSILKDTICNNTRTNITLTTPNVMTAGNVTFDYTSLADAGLSGNTTAISNLPDSHVIEDLLNNSTVYPAISPQVVRYTITPKSLATGCADGPAVIDSITVHPTAYTDFNPVDSVRCFGESNGSANIIARNGINEFTYLWNDLLGQTDSTASGLSRGEYIVTVTDNQSCIKVDTVFIEEPDTLLPIIDTVKDVSCNSAGDGYIIMAPTGGNGTYSYDWGALPQYTDSVGQLSGGWYFVTITDWKGCASDTTMKVEEPAQLNLFVDHDDVSCFGDTDGWACAPSIGYVDYKWSTGETTRCISNLSPDKYYVTATTSTGCEDAGSVTIDNINLLLVDSIKTTSISCEGDADGTIKIDVIGGNTEIDYTYTWFTLDGSGLEVNSADQSGLSGGTYYLTVNDWKGCETDTFTMVNEPPDYFSEIAFTDVTCFEDSDGSINLTVTGGNTESPYKYKWEGTVSNNLDSAAEDQNDLSGGQYYVTITDAKDCEIYDTAIIFEPELLEAVITGENSSCYGYEDGMASVEITGGNGGYSINWNPGGQTTSSISGLSSGTYVANVIDSKGCAASDEISISEPDEIINNIYSENITCFGYSNGQIIITPQGGITPYTYQWSHSALFIDSLATSLAPGDYSISVVDDNNCLEVSFVEITQPDPLTLTATKEDITCYGLDDGYISLSMFGGTPEYTYNWSNGLTTNSGDQLPPGTYQINISDIHDCQVDTNILIDEPNKLTLTPAVVRPTCPDIRDGSIELNISGGRTPYIIYWDDGFNEENLYEIRSGIYEVLVTDSSSCETDSTFIVKSAFDDCIDIPSAFTPNDDGVNDTWVIDMQGLYPNAEIEVFDRWGKIVFYSKGYEEDQYWDGTYNGRKLPMDAYYYIIHLKNGAERISGTVTIMR